MGGRLFRKGVLKTAQIIWYSMAETLHENRVANGFVSDATLAMRWTRVLGSWRMATSDASDAEDAVRMMCGNSSGDHGFALIFGDQFS